MIPSSSNSRRSHFTAAAATILASALLSSSSSSSVFAAPPQFVQACLNGIYDGVNLIQVNCTTRADSGEYIINNSSGTTIIKNCQFNGCGSIHAKTDVQFINVLFNSSSYGGTNSQFNGGAGGAVAINGVNGYFSNVTFSNCKANHGGAVIVTGTNPTLYMDNIRAIGNRATSTSSYGGGVVYIDANVTTPVVVKNSYFESNIAYRGGSFFVSGSSTLNITNSVFRNGSTYNSRGGDVHVNGGQLTWTGGASYGSYENIDYSNTTQTLTLQGASGGSVSLLGGSASVSGIHFEGQRVAYYGAVFYCYGPANLSIDSITTNDTQSYQMGGLIYSLNTPNLTLTNSVITNPLAAQGSGVASNWGLLYMNNVTVYNSSTINVAAGFIGDGPGANTTLVNVNVYGSRTINQSTIDNNGVGGAIFTVGNYLTIINSHFDNCSGVLGGIISSFGTLGSPIATAQNSQLANITLINTVMSNSVAQQGGAIHCQNCIVTATDSSFIGNNATNYGGAIMLEIWNSQLCPAFFGGSAIFINNSVTTTGKDQGDNSQGGSLYMDSNANVTFATTNLTMVGNKAVLGSAIYNSDWHWAGATTMYGLIVYAPVSSDSVINIEGTVYYAHKDYSSWAAKPAYNPFPYATTKVYSDSDFTGVGLSFPWQSSLDYSSLPLDLSVPDLSFNITNAFGLPVALFLPTHIPIVKAEFSLMRNPLSSSPNVANVGNVIFTTYKGPSNSTDAVADFRNVTLDASKFNDPSFNGTIQATYYVVSNTDSSGSGQSVVLHFNYASCDSRYNAMVASTDASGNVLTNQNGKTIYTCVPKVSVSSAARYAFFALGTLIAIIAVAFGVYAHLNREAKIYKVTSPFFTNLITFGCILMLLSVMVEGFVNSNYNCMAGQWLEILGFVIIGFSVILKTSRIKAIFINTLKTRGRADSITNELLGYWVLLFMIVTIVFLATWQKFGTLSILDLDPTLSDYSTTVERVHFNGNKGWVQTDYCALSSSTGSSIFPLLAVLIHILVEIVAAYYAFSCRTVPAQYNETASMLIMSYTWFIANGILYPLGQYLLIQPTGSFVIRMIRTLLPVCVTLYVLHVPRAYIMIMHPSQAGSKGSTYSNGSSSNKKGSSKGDKKNSSNDNINTNKSGTQKNSNKSSQPSRLYGASLQNPSNNSSNNLSQQQQASQQGSQFSQQTSQIQSTH